MKKWFFNDFSQQKLNFQILKVLSGHFPNNFFKKFFFLKGVFFDDTNDGVFKNIGYILKNSFFGRFLGRKIKVTFLKSIFWAFFDDFSKIFFFFKCGIFSALQHGCFRFFKSQCEIGPGSRFLKPQVTKNFKKFFSPKGRAITHPRTMTIERKIVWTTWNIF